jgi:hypothetical protein
MGQLVRGESQADEHHDVDFGGVGVKEGAAVAMQRLRDDSSRPENDLGESNIELVTPNET